MPLQVCRVCYRTGHDFLNLDVANLHSKKLAACVPEIDIFVIDKPGLCETCLDMLNVAYEFRETCLKNEKRYNDTFNRQERFFNTVQRDTITQNIVVNIQNIVANNNNTATVSTGAVLSSPQVSVSVDNQNVAITPINPTLLCDICNKQFSSQHDKKFHDYKLHRQIKYLKKFIKLLPPIKTNAQEIVPENVMDDDPEGNESLNNNSSDNNVQTNEIIENESNHVEKQNFVCKKCNLTFIDACELESHNLIHVNNLCQICGKSFDTRSSLEAHRKLHNTVCCGKYFTTPTLLQLHTYKEHNNTCGICNKVFNQFSLLFHHLLDHMGDISFKCNLCTKQFKTKVHLDKHMCNSNENNINTDMQCVKCNLHFNSSNELLEHRQLRHKRGRKRKVVQSSESSESNQSNERNGINCTKCNLIFTTRKKFWRHFYKKHSKEDKMETETNEIPPNVTNHDCQLCYQTFYFHAELQEHVLQFHCVKELKIPIVDCRKDSFYRQQEGLRINFSIPPEPSQVSEIENFCILKQELSNRSKRICFFCRLMFSSRIELYKHLQYTHRECCANKFNNLAMLVKHNFVHYNEIEKEGTHDEITCMQCVKVFRNYKSLLSHSCIRDIVGKSPTQQQSIREKPLCTIEDHESDSDESEMTENDYEEPIRMQCEICKETFDFKTDLLDHVKTTHI